MKRFGACAIILAGLASLQAQEAIAPPRPQGKVIVDSWQTASFDGIRTGFVHLSVTELTPPNGQKFWRASRHLVLTVRRFGDNARIEAITGSDETPDGKVLGTFMQQVLGRDVMLTVRGVVNGNQLHVKAEGRMQFDKQIPWDPAVVGTWGELNSIIKMKPQPGTKFDYVIYEPIINSLVKVHAEANAFEEVAIAGQKPTLLKITAQPQDVAGVQLPASAFWFDARYEVVKSETAMPGLGRLVLERSNQTEALKPCVGPDLGWRQSIALKQALRAPHESELVVYKIQVKDREPGTVFAKDERQSVKIINGNTVELQVQPVREPAAGGSGSASPGQEYLEANNFLNSDDALVKQHAATAIGSESEPWKKSQAIERWVHQNMRAMNFTEAMAPAAEVARTLTGDCTEYSMLVAAMCRAVGVPSRTALGLVYVDARDGRPPMLAMHMWTEVFINGRWIGLDATLGRGNIGAGHIKVTDHSWHKVATMTPLMPLMRVMMSEPTVEIAQEQRNKS